jgi:hypothetical protein
VQSTLRSNAADCRASLKAAGDPFLLVPTVMHHYTVRELLEQEREGNVGYNSHLGTFTNFVNLLGMCAISVPFSKFEVEQEPDSVRHSAHRAACLDGWRRPAPGLVLMPLR